MFIYSHAAEWAIISEAVFISNFNTVGDLYTNCREMCRCKYSIMYMADFNEKFHCC